MRSITFKLALLFMAGFLGMELLSRALGFGYPALYTASPAGYEFRPNQAIKRLTKTATYNNFGMRGPDITASPQAGVTRILSLGDSVSNGGSMVNDEETYPQRLQQRYQQAGQSVEVLNVAVGGWSVENSRRWLAAHGTFGASTVLLQINENDLTQGFVDATVLDTHVSFPTHRPTLALHEIYKRYAMPRLGLSRSDDPGSTTGHSGLAATSATQAAVKAVHVLAAAAQAELVILYWDPLVKSQAADIKDAREQLFAWAQRMGVRVLRPRGDDNTLDTSAWFTDNIHPNALGNQGIADHVFAHLRSAPPAGKELARPSTPQLDAAICDRKAKNSFQDGRLGGCKAG